MVRIEVVGGPLLIALGSFFTDCVVMSGKPFRFLNLKFYHACLSLRCLCLFLLPLFFFHFLSPKILQRHRRTTVIPKTTYVTKCEHPTLDFNNSGFLVAEETKTKMGLLLFCLVMCTHVNLVFESILFCIDGLLKKALIGFDGLGTARKATLANMGDHFIPCTQV